VDSKRFYISLSPRFDDSERKNYNPISLVFKQIFGSNDSKKLEFDQEILIESFSQG
jgi:hypothetical protein